MSADFSKPKKATAIIIFIAVLTIIFYYLLNAEAISLPSVEISQVSRENYDDSLNLYHFSPSPHTSKKAVNSTDSAAFFYRIHIHDKGFSREMPICVEIFLATDSNHRFIMGSDFVKPGTKKHSILEPKYLNTIALVDAYGPESNSIIIMLGISTVYTYQNSQDYMYRASAVCNLNNQICTNFTYPAGE